MDLFLTVGGVGAAGPGADVLLHADGAVTVGEVAAAIARHFGAGEHRRTLACARLLGPVDPSVALTASGLCTGDLVTLDAVGAANEPRPTTDLARPAARTLVFLEGPMSGHTVALAPGRHVLGRSSRVTIPVEDPNLSRQHLIVEVGDAIIIEDAGSTNGTWVGGKRIVGPHELKPGTAVEVGDSIITLVHDGVARPVAVHAGTVAFNRPPRIEPPYEGRDVVIPAPPQDPPRVRFPLFMCIIPVVFALVMLGISLTTDNATFGILSIAFFAMSPLMAVGSYWESRRGNRKDHEEAVRKHAAKVDAIIETLDRELVDEGEARRRQLPEIGEMFRRARELAPNLWERGPEDSDFLHLRVGTAELPSLTTVSVEAGGSDELSARLHRIPDRYATVPDVPLALDLRALGGIGIAGPQNLADGFARWLVLQAASLHSPADLSIVGLLDDQDETGWSFLKWLPHTRLAASPLRGPHVALRARDQYELLGRLYELFNARMEWMRGQPAGTARHGADVLVVIDGRTPLERSQLHDLLERGKEVGISFVWIGREERELPRPCGAVVLLESTGRLATATARFGAGGLSVAEIIAESVGAEPAREWARILAPVVDTSRRTSAGAELPDVATLADALGDGAIVSNPTAVRARWGESLPLRAAVGMSEEGAFCVDLRMDGPHGLIAGTTGAGKSEFLQAWLASLALSHSPRVINFLLVDYKGGSAFLDCADLPHCVGLVTNLDAHLVQRALISLKAELEYRERVLSEHGAKDIRDLERTRPDIAPPSLVIVIDEFATLAKEVPDFVDGVVDIARLGRSLGVHLVLATQRPADAVTETIRANTNLRIALRVANDGESADVIGTNGAARIERDRPGRAFARIGHRELVAFQSAYVGGEWRPERDSRSVAVVDFETGRDPLSMLTRPSFDAIGAETELAVVVRTVREAAAQDGIEGVRAPWLPPLPASVAWVAARDVAADGVVMVGTLDEPQLQLQRPATLDFERDGSVLVFGASGSGKSNALITLAASFVADRSAADVQVMALDCSSRSLSVLEALPHVGAVVSGDDEERVGRLLHGLRAELRRRTELLGAVGVTSLAMLRSADPANAPARILVLVDDYAAFVAGYERVDGGELVDLLPRLVAEGRAVGIHFAITGDRRAAIPAAVNNAISRRLVLRMANVEEVTSFGLHASQFVADAPAGRGYLDQLEVQVATVGVGGSDQRAALAAMAAEAERTHPGVRAPAVGALPELVESGALAPGEAMVPNIGVGYEQLMPVGFDLRDSGAIVAGPLRSGRTSALRAIVEGTIATQAGVTCSLISPRRSPLCDLAVWANVAVGEAAAIEFVEALCTQLATAPGAGPHLVVVDDASDFVESELDYRLADLVKLGREHAVSVVVAAETQAARRSMFSGMFAELRKDKQGVLLQPEVDVDGDIFGVQLPRRTRLRFPPGRGYLVRRGQLELVQLAR